MRAKYKVVSDTLEKEIKEGIYDKNNKIPTEGELIKRFDVSRNTIRKAIESLVQKGCVYQIQGSGIFVRESVDTNTVTTINLQDMSGVTKDFADKKVETKVVDFKLIKADKNIAQKMKCEIGTPIYFVNRVRILDGESHIVEYSYFNKDLILFLDKEIIKGSIYNYIRQDLKLTIGLVDRIIYSDYLSERDAKLLGLRKNEPALINENIVRLGNGEIFDYSKSVLNYKNIRFTFLSNLK